MFFFSVGFIFFFAWASLVTGIFLVKKRYDQTAPRRGVMPLHSSENDLRPTAGVSTGGGGLARLLME